MAEHTATDVASEQVTGDAVPSLRIGFTTDRKAVEFSIDGKFSLYNNAGVALVRNVTATSSWHLHIELITPAEYYYNILVGKFDTYEAADDLCYTLLEKGIGVQIKTVGGEWPGEDPILFTDREYWVVVDHFSSEKEALTFCQQNLRDMSNSIFREKQNEASVRMEVLDDEMEKVCEADNCIHFFPETPETTIRFTDFIPGHNSHAQRQTVEFKHALELSATNQGALCLAMEMDAEAVLCGMMAPFARYCDSGEFLKSLAVVLRSNIVSEINRGLLCEVFDWNMNGYAESFKPAFDMNSTCTSASVATAGQVLADKSHLIPGSLTYSCGGYLEGTSNGQAGQPLMCSDESTAAQIDIMTNDTDLHRWIDSCPDVLCNPFSTLSQGRWNEYFRWKTERDRLTLESQLSEYAGRDIGELFEVLLTKRSPSGRVLELEILASNINLVLTGDAEIMRALNIRSTYFYLEREFDDDHIPELFYLNGAGEGHGKGLCLAGAAFMAKQGKSCEQILQQYFKQSKLITLY